MILSIQEDRLKGAVLVETDNSGVKKLLGALKNNCGIGILPDHTPKINQGVMSKFYNSYKYNIINI